MQRPPIVGLIANPASSKDIRRLVGLARVVDVEEKANLIARFLTGLTAGPPVRVAALDDSAGLVRRAIRLARGHAIPAVEFLDVEAEGSEADTRRAAEMLRDRGAALLVTVGGDGTIRSAVEGWPTATLLPLAAGTNNAIVVPVEPTIAGHAAAMAASTEDDISLPLTLLVVESGSGAGSVAVVDAVGVRSRWTGARALWEPDSFVEAVVANVNRPAVGMASVAAALGPIPQGHARYIRFGPGERVRAIVGPGLVLDVEVASHSLVAIGARIAMDERSRLIALDGERRMIGPGATVTIASGPRLLMVESVLWRTRKPIEGTGFGGLDEE